MDIGLLIKTARKYLGYSMKSLATKTGISSSTIKSYESNETEPDVANLVKLMNALEIPLSEVDISKKNVNICIDDVNFTNSYTKNHQTYLQGTCKCGKEIFKKEEDVLNLNITKCKECMAKEFAKKTSLKLTELDIEKLNTIFQTNIVKRSAKLNVDCNINLESYLEIITKNCYYCGCKPNQQEIINGKVFLHNGIDRLDSKKGYVEGNIVPCCTTCNMAKGSLSEQEFLQLVENIYLNKKKTK